MPIKRTARSARTVTKDCGGEPPIPMPHKDCHGPIFRLLRGLQRAVRGRACAVAPSHKVPIHAQLNHRKSRTSKALILRLHATAIKEHQS
eukprot:6465667-Amphidinium_carterae.2